MAASTTDDTTDDDAQITTADPIDGGDVEDPVSVWGGWFRGHELTAVVQYHPDTGGVDMQDGRERAHYLVTVTKWDDESDDGDAFAFPYWGPTTARNLDDYGKRALWNAAMEALPLMEYAGPYDEVPTPGGEVLERFNQWASEYGHGDACGDALEGFAMANSFAQQFDRLGFSRDDVAEMTQKFDG